MSASPAQIAANQANARKSSGPTSNSGKEISRRNALKHGLTGAGVVLPNEDAAEVERRLAAYQQELKPSGEVGRALALRAAVCSVRMERCVAQETAALSERVRRAEADFVAPEGVSAEEAERLRAEAGRRATFDPSPEACLARKYEAAAERGFFRALKELRQVERAAKAADPAAQAEAFQRKLASFMPLEEIDADLDRIEAKFDRMDAVDAARMGRAVPSRSAGVAPTAHPAVPSDYDELLLAIGRPR
jgi:hypothetical protein